MCVGDPKDALAMKLALYKSREGEMKMRSKNTSLPGVFTPSTTFTRAVFIVLLFAIAFSANSYAQQTTGQLLISSGFNPVAATTTEAMARLTSFPANRFLLRNKGGHPYYFYADPTGCGCAYVGSVSAMKKYSASFGALPADALPSGGGPTKLEQSMIDSMDNDDAGAQFNEDVFGPDP
jgi:hypothetical protein